MIKHKIICTEWVSSVAGMRGLQIGSGVRQCKNVATTEYKGAALCTRHANARKQSDALQASQSPQDQVKP